tara:strand:+ start:1132 stop:2493 length:1362 start_codon:yes stop_codon:yes gene_type:complete
MSYRVQTIKNLRTVKALRGQSLTIDLGKTFTGTMTAWMKKKTTDVTYRSFDIVDNRFLFLTKEKTQDYHDINSPHALIEAIAGKWHFDVRIEPVGNTNPDLQETLITGTLLFSNHVTDSSGVELVNSIPTATPDQDLSGIATNASDISSLESGQTVQNTAIALNTAKVSYPGDQDLSGIATNASAIATNVSNIATNVSDISALETSQGVQDTAIALNTAKVSNVAETVTSISLAANILTYTDENGSDTDLDLALYLDDSNLARLTSGTLNASTGVATFTRDDLSTFTIDMSAFLDAITLNNTLTSTSTTEGLTANMGKELKDLIDGLVLSAGTNTGDELPASTTVAGVIEIATNTEANAGTLTNIAITPANLKNVLGTTASLSTTLTYSQLVGGATSQIITHSIGNQFVQVSVYEVAGMDKVECEVELTSATTTTLKFNVAPASNALRVVIVG